MDFIVSNFEEAVLLGSYPDSSPGVGSDAVGQTVLRELVEKLPLKSLFDGQLTVEAGDPETSGGIPAYRANGWERESFARAGEFGNTGKDQVEAAAIRSGPDVSIVILGNAVDPEMGCGNALQLCLMESEEPFLAGANPDGALVIFLDGGDLGVRGEAGNRCLRICAFEMDEIGFVGDPEAGIAGGGNFDR